MKSESTFHIDDVKIEGVLVSGNHGGSDPSQKPAEVKYDPMETEVSEAHSLDSGPSESSRPEEQRSHAEEKTSDGKFECSFQLSSDTIQTNQQIKVKEFACFACDYKASRMEVVVQHILSVHPSPQVKTTSLVLVQQPNSAPLPSNQQEMVVAESEPVSATVDNVTTPEFINSSVQLEVKNEPTNKPQNDPVEVHSAVSPVSQGEKNFTGEACKICGHLFLNNVDAEQHMKFHWEPLGPVGTKRFPCIVCSFRTKEKSCLTRHLLTHFGRKPFACDVCGSRFNRKDSLMKHLRTHTRMKQQSGGTNKPECESSVNVGTASELTSFSSDYESNNATDVESHVTSVDSSHIPGTPAELVARPNSTTALDGFEETTAVNPNYDVVTLSMKTETSDDPLNPYPDEPSNDPLQMEQSEEHSQDSDPSSIYGLGLTNAAGNVKLFKCEFCDYENRKKSDFVVHMRTHTGETPFACDLCDKRYIAKKTLNRHKKVHHGENLFTCELCDFCTAHKSNLDRHLLTHNNFEGTVSDPLELDEAHHDPSNLYLSEDEDDTTDTAGNLFACGFCDEKFTTKSTMDRHVRESHGENWFSCSLCHYRANTKSELTEHLKTHIESMTEEDSHVEPEDIKPSPDDLELNELSNNSGPSESTQPGNDPWGTEFDDAHYEPTNETFQLELSNEHSQDSGVSRSSSEMNSTKNKRWTCDVCGYKTSRKYEYTVHMRTHTGEKPFKCSLCDYRTVRKSYVAKHMKTHVQKNAKNATSLLQVESTCDSPEFRDSGNGLSETTPGRSPSEDEHFSCEHCNYECDGITAWSQHMFEHTNEKTYSCDNCDYKTKYKWDMDEHKSKHVAAIAQQSANAVKITCEFCDYGFISKDDMSQHIMASHPEKCPHSCDKCDFKAFNVRSLDWHMETHSKPYACSLCDYRVEEESLLTSHIMSAHADVEEYVCYSCDYKASNVKDVEQHILTTHSLSTVETAPYVLAEAPSNVIDPSILPQPHEYLCYACDFKATELAEVEAHIMVTHPTPVVQEVAVPLVSVKSEVPDFVASSDTGSEEYFCLTCDYKASSVLELEQHIQSSHNPTSESTA